MRAPCRPRACVAQLALLGGLCGLWWLSCSRQQENGSPAEGPSTRCLGGRRPREPASEPATNPRLVRQQRVADDEERMAWAALKATASSRCHNHTMPGIQAKAGRPHDIPIVIMAGYRAEYLRQVLQSLDVAPRLVIVSFNTPPTSPRHSLAESFQVARQVKHLRIRPLHVELECGECGVKGNAYVKRVWVETVRRVFGLLDGYDVRPGIPPALLPHFLRKTRATPAPAPGV